MQPRKFLTMVLLAACGAAPAAPDGRAPLAASRERIIQWLHDYEQAGAFPIDAQGLPISVFEDAHGTRCAMAELIHLSGRDDLVDSVAKHDNTLRLAEVDAGPLLGWIHTSGLTQDEVAMIQGALDIDYAKLRREVARPDLAPIARAEIRGRLETAELALRKDTPHSLDVAAHDLKVAPRDRQRLAASRTTAALPRTSESSR